MELGWIFVHDEDLVQDNLIIFNTRGAGIRRRLVVSISRQRRVQLGHDHGWPHQTYLNDTSYP